MDFNSEGMQVNKIVSPAKVKPKREITQPIMVPKTAM